MKNKKEKFTVLAIVYILAATVASYGVMVVKGMDLTNLILGLGGFLIVNIGAYSIINVKQKEVISKYYREELSENKVVPAEEVERGEI